MTDIRAAGVRGDNLIILLRFRNSQQRAPCKHGATCGFAPSYRARPPPEVAADPGSRPPEPK